MSYAFDTTSATVTGAQAMYKLKVKLIAQGWVVKASGDGIAAYGASSDVITSGNAGANGWANGTTSANGAWVRFQDPAGVRELLIQRCNTNLVWNVRYSKSAKFTGGSPSATAAPTATDSQNICSNTTIFAADSGYRYYCAVSNVAPYSFWAGAFPTGGGNPTHAFIYGETTGMETGEDNISIHIIQANAFLASTMTTFQGWAGSGLTYERWRTAIVAPPYTDASAGANVIPSLLNVNPHSGNDESFEIFLGEDGTGTFPGGMRGFLAWDLIGWNGAAKTTGDTMSTTGAGSKDRIVFRDCNLVWDGSTPTV